MKERENPYTVIPIEDSGMFLDRHHAINLVNNTIRSKSPGRCSCAVIGGPYMGKTSLLKHIERMLEIDIKNAENQCVLMPVYFAVRSIREGIMNPTQLFFEQLIDLIKKQVFKYTKQYFGAQIEYFTSDLSKSDIRDNEYFEFELGNIIDQVSFSIHEEVKIIILIDNLDRLLQHKDLRVSIAETLVEILTGAGKRKELRSAVSFILACTDEIQRFFPLSHTELLSQLEPVYLKVLDKNSCIELIRGPAARCGWIITEEVAEEIFRWTGGHPKLVHRLMRKICDEYDNLIKYGVSFIELSAIEITHSDRFIAEIVLEFIQTNPFIQPVFDVIRQHQSPITLQEVQRTLPKSFANVFVHLHSALMHLEFLGIVTQSGKGKEQAFLLNGEFCRQWFAAIFHCITSNDQDRESNKSQNIDNHLITFIKEIVMEKNYNIHDVSGSNFNIDSWLDKVTQNISNLPKSDQDTTEKEELTKLVAQLMGLLKQVPPGQAEEAQTIAERVETALKEAGKNKPEKEIMKINLESLQKAATNIASVLPTVLPLAMEIANRIQKMIP